MKVSTRNLQQALLLCIGIAFFAPSLWFHLRIVDISCQQQQQQHGPPVVSVSLATSREALELQDQNNGQRDTVIDSSTSNNNNDSGSICGSSLLSTRSPFSLWMEHLPQILDHSRLAQDKKFQLHDLTLQVLQLYTPRLPLSVRTVTRNPTTHLNALFQKTRQRYEYLLLQQQQQQQQEATREDETKSSSSSSSSSSEPPPPPVKIVVLGGSVTAGVNCISGVGNANLGLCAWPVRLETLINGMVHDMILAQQAEAEAEASSSSRTKPRPQQQQSQSLPLTLPLVKVHVFAIGGSNTQTATTLLEYDLLPRLAKNPDIIINAYSTNDMHVDTVKMATSLQKTLSDLVFDMMQNFVRVVLRPRLLSPIQQSSSSCQNQLKQQYQSSQSPPVLVWLDDYLGNEQRFIMETTAVSKAMHLLANYYGFASISYADAIRDVVYGDTHEQLFSPHWYKGLGGNGKNKKNKGGGGGGDNFAREIHPGQGMHMATAWTVAYNLLHLATHYCSIQQAIPPAVGNEQTAAAESAESAEGQAFSPWPGLPQLRQVKQIGGSIAHAKPGPTPDTLPPPLTGTLNLRRVSADWQESHQAFLFQKAAAAAAVENNNTSPAAHCSTSEKNDDDDDDEYKQCPFSWIVGLPVNGRNVDLFHERESNAQDDMKEIHDYFVQHATKSDLGGWQVQDDSNNRKKYGWVPPPPVVTADATTAVLQSSATMALEFWNLTQPIRTITLFTMRSYGDKWANSTVKVVISTAATAARGQLSNGNGNGEKIVWSTAAEKDMLGFHDKHTSEMYTEPIELQDPVQPGKGLKIAITLIRGTTFKIQGMAVCS